MTDPSVDQRISECGKAMAMAAVPVYTVNGSVHPPTLVTACARMAGYYLLRAAAVVTPAMKPGEAVLSQQAAVRAPVLLRTCAAVLATLGNVIPPDPPSPLVDEKVAPREDFLATQSRLAPIFAPLRARFALDDDQSARAAAVAAAITAHTVRKHLDVERGFGLAAFAFTEGSRTVPSPETTPSVPS